MDNTLTTKGKWESVWASVKLPTIQKPEHDIQKQLETYLPPSVAHSLIEIGCAPGSWMAYFNKHFGYQVAGLEYAETAANATKQNMEMQAIDADVFVQDFLLFDCLQNKYDIVFSAGFIEHFRDVSPVVEKICALSKGYVVTIVPNIFGVNGYISKTVRPKVYAEHNPIDVPLLDRLHTNYGIRTLFCDYVGGVKFIMPGAHNDFFNMHRYCAEAVNAPLRIANRLSAALSRICSCTPRSRLFSASLLYIGTKNNQICDESITRL